ncbi:IS110 family transposase [Paenibacillus cremeus]|uniref:IS110 family transposase n=1 Tax=Paenibacillus cremeus TaxID=2163881 RepID=A0A559K069_9BACL|nr:transposase [Paenibacillus cremeus]TVY05450.1 IS110 family transposase [Paenibacillus cremeus]
MMEAILERCAGLDVHQETVVACVLSGPLDRAPRMEIRTFGTMTEDLLELGEWLTIMECSHVAMESTGIYWKPVWNVLEALDVELILANAHHVKNLPGRKKT